MKKTEEKRKRKGLTFSSLEHHEWLLTLENKLYVAPIPKEKKLNRVLDVGTGTGIWAIDFADEHPESEVIGNDLSPIQPSFVPPNLRFEVDDIEDEWIYKNKFDLIHCRMLSGSIADWPRVCRLSPHPSGFLFASKLRT